MSSGRLLCLNMIVKNETANLERCLSAVAPFLSCWVIGDTGSTDGTQAFILEFFAKRGIPGELHEFPFENFEQARNEALKRAYDSKLSFDYLLFDDADMELVVEDEEFRVALQAPGYQLMQRSTGGLKYWNTRLVRREIGAWYHGVTHEYLDVPGGTEKLENAWYRDHASGSNRVDKFERDIRLLKAALKKHPNNERYWFYLAQSYQDAGRPKEAAEAYRKRAGMGGWDEEAWTSRLRLARNLAASGDDAGFVFNALAAFDERPWRAEPLYNLARHFRIAGQNHASALFAERGLEISSPEDDILFIEDWVYQYGLREEFSIAANYAKDPARKVRGFAACNALALDRSIPTATRDLAASNLKFYIQPASEIMPSFAASPVQFALADGYRAMNPSIVRVGSDLMMVLRAVNYSLAPECVEEDADRYQTSDGSPFKTQNFLLRLDAALSVVKSVEIANPSNLPEPAGPLVQGFEDIRPFVWHNELWCIACTRELNADGWCEQVLARIDMSDEPQARLIDWRVLRPTGEQRHEKNWMPCSEGDALRFVYSCDPTRFIDEQAVTISQNVPPISAQDFRGGSSLMPFDGGWLALVHQNVMEQGRREHWHRFVWFDREFSLRDVSRPFYFKHRGIEFATGLAWHTDGQRLVASFGVNDSEAWLATFSVGDVRQILNSAETPSNVVEAIGLQRVSQVGAKEGARRSRVMGASTAETFLEIAPFLSAADSPLERREKSQEFDRPIERLLGDPGSALPQVHCFYEVLSETGRHDGLVAAISSMRAAGHPVKLWSYSPGRLKFLDPFGVELCDASEVVPKAMFEQVVAGSEIRYFSDVFRYAVLYEHGGLWLDGDVVLFRPFRFQGEHFFNLQWRPGPQNEHFVCGNVIYARRHSVHLHNLYRLSLERFYSADGNEFGDVGPKLLSDYIASPAGADLQDQVFSPMFFNALDWTESDLFDKPLAQLRDYLNDERVFGMHMWTARHNPQAGNDGRSFIAMLSDPLREFPSFGDLAEQFATDKNRSVGNRHCYMRVYDRLLSGRRLSLRRLMEIARSEGPPNPAVAQLWARAFPFAEIVTVDMAILAATDEERLLSLAIDQSRSEDLQRLSAKFALGSLDVIIDDGSHASHDQQRTLKALFPMLAEGGWYFIEDLDWQPPGENSSAVSLTKELLAAIKEPRVTLGPDPFGIKDLASEIDQILFFDSHYEVSRARHFGGLVAIRKRGGSVLLD